MNLFRGLPAGRQVAQEMAMYFVYVLFSQKVQELYIGLTKDLEKRIEEHNKGYAQATYSKGPYKLLYYEESKDRVEARKLEKEFKKGYKREYFKKLIPR